MESKEEGGQYLKDDVEHIQFVKSLIADATDYERVNYCSYLKALQDGLLENHQGRYIYISKGKMLNKSFKRPHDAVDHLPSKEDSFPYEHAVFIYVPHNKGAYTSRK
jgi:hypothetical protein